jgi:hypothetical protein
MSSVGWFGCVIRHINKNTHPLVSGTVRINGSARLTGALDLDSVLT